MSGIWIHGENADATTLARTSVWWNDVAVDGDAGDLALKVEFDPSSAGDYWHAECNWWGHASGPYDPSDGPPDKNEFATGQPVSDWFWYRDPIDNIPHWLDESIATETECGP